MISKHLLFVFVLTLSACRPLVLPATPMSTLTATSDTATPSFTPIVETPTATQISTLTVTSPPPTQTIDLSLVPTLTFTSPPLIQTIELTFTPTFTPTSRPTQPTEGPGPGLVVRGTVKLADGTPVEGVNIYVAFASYGGNVVATTNSDGYYSSEYIYIYSDETVRVWAEAAGYSFKPGDGSAAWTGTEFYWRHYFGFEERSLDFIAMSDSPAN